MEFGREICCSLAKVVQRETKLAAPGNVMVGELLRVRTATAAAATGHEDTDT
jgi:hypothetical protein